MLLEKLEDAPPDARTVFAPQQSLYQALAYLFVRVPGQVLGGGNKDVVVFVFEKFEHRGADLRECIVRQMFYQNRLCFGPAVVAGGEPVQYILDCVVKLLGRQELAQSANRPGHLGLRLKILDDGLHGRLADLNDQADRILFFLQVHAALGNLNCEAAQQGRGGLRCTPLCKPFQRPDARRRVAVNLGDLFHGPAQLARRRSFVFGQNLIQESHCQTSDFDFRPHNVVG